MTHDDQSTRFTELLQLLGEHGFDQTGSDVNGTTAWYARR